MQNLIKFSLPINGVNVDYLEQLKENFVVNEVLDMYKSKILQHWLKHRGYTDELNKVEDLNQFLDDDDLKESLIEIFDLDEDDVINTSAIDLDDLDETEIYDIIRPDLYEEYSKVVERLLENADSKSWIAEDVQALVKAFLPFFAVDHWSLAVIYQQPLIFLMLLGQPEIWPIYQLGDPSNREDSLFKLAPEVIDPTGEKRREDPSFQREFDTNGLERMMEEEFDSFSQFFESTTLYASDRDTKGRWNTHFKPGERYLVWVDDPDEVKIRSASGQTMHHDHLYLVNGLEYQCQPSSYGSASVYIMQVS